MAFGMFTRGYFSHSTAQRSERGGPNDDPRPARDPRLPAGTRWLPRSDFDLATLILEVESKVSTKK